MDTITDTTPLNPLALAVKALRRRKLSLARVVNLSTTAVWKWQRDGRFPRSEHTGETDYAGMIANAIDGEVSKAALLEWSSKGWTAPQDTEKAA